MTQTKRKKTIKKPSNKDLRRKQMVQKVKTTAQVVKKGAHYYQ